MNRAITVADLSELRVGIYRALWIQAIVIIGVVVGLIKWVHQ